MIEVTATAGLATVQDLGRDGSLRYGVGRAGAMDRVALAAANMLLGNDEDAAGIEMQVFPFPVRFTADCAFAITGVDCAARLDGQALLPWSVISRAAGQELVLGLPQAGAWRASRAYLALPGGVDVPRCWARAAPSCGARSAASKAASCSAATISGLPTPGEAPAGFGLVPPALALPLEADGVPAVRVLPAGEYGCFTPAAQDASGRQSGGSRRRATAMAIAWQGPLWSSRSRSRCCRTGSCRA